MQRRFGKTIQKKGYRTYHESEKDMPWPIFPVTVYQGKGRPRIYGRKVKLWDFFTELSSTAEISVYGEAKTIITNTAFMT